MDQRGRIKLGFAPTRRVLTTPKAFNKDEARRIKDEIEEKLSAYEGLEIINLNFLNEEGLLFDPNDALKAAKHFIDSGVDAVFVPHCNFGSEEAVCRLARRWASRFCCGDRGTMRPTRRAAACVTPNAACLPQARF